MLVGFDATTIRGNKTGVGYYTSRLLERLTLVEENRNPIDELTVLSNLDVRVLREIPRVSVYSSGRFRVRAVWMQAVLPLILRRLRPDLCHFTNFLAPVGSDTPFVVTFHDMSLQLMPGYHTLRKRLLSAGLMPTVAKRARLIITPSQSAKEDVVRILGVSKDKIRIIPHAPGPLFRPHTSEESFARLSKAYGLRKPYLLYVGTLEPRKNIARALQAFANVKDRFRDHLFYLAGDFGWLYGDVLKAITELGLEGSVRLLGYVDEADLPPLYSHADLFVYPSLYEGFGFPVVEAMACGTPVLTSNTSSLPEVAGDAALLVDPLNVNGMAEAMEFCLTTEAERWRLAARGLERAASLSWEETARRTVAVYEEAAERATLRARTVGARPTMDVAARAVVETVRYGSFFGFPMKLEEIHRGLFAVALEKTGIESLLASHPTVKEWVEKRGRYYFLRGRGHEIALRWSRERATRRLLSRHQRALQLLVGAPFVRMVALSGATAHGNAADGDIDLFLITAPKRVWAVFLILLLAAKVAGLRRVLCVNYLLSEDHLRLTEHDPFTANQLVSLKPLAGRETYFRLIRANAWGAAYFPNFWSCHREFIWNNGSIRSAGAPWIEALLGLGGGWVLEHLGELLLRRYLQGKRRAEVPDAVKLEEWRVKLHFQDNGHPLAAKLHEMMAETRQDEEVFAGQGSRAQDEARG